MENRHSETLDLICSMNRLGGLYRMAASKNGLKLNTLVFLCAIDDGKVHTQKQLCDEWLTPRTTINTIVKECVSAGFISLHSMDHSKEKAILITEQGKNYIEETTKDVYSAEKRAMKQTQNEYDMSFIAAVQAYVSSLEKELEQKVFDENMIEAAAKE